MRYTAEEEERQLNEKKINKMLYNNEIFFFTILSYDHIIYTETHTSNVNLLTHEQFLYTYPMISCVPE